jgi:SAM-dependent methyltransferase
VELSRHAAERATAANIEVHHGTFQDNLYPESFFSGVSAFAVIEHLVDPSAFLLEVRRVLKDGGVFALMTGDPDSFRARILGRRWRLYTPPAHQFFFPAKSLDARLRELGFSKLTHFYSAGGMVGPVASIMRLPLKVVYVVAEMMPIVNRLPVLDHYYAYYRLMKMG